MKRAAMTMMLLVLAAGCFDEINYIHHDPVDSPTRPTLKCDAGEVIVLPPPPEPARCGPGVSDGGVD